ncbi:MAG: DNA-protecting protein DprA [Planctomycetes bacterium]|nr:DNA-protecting protein DprA [Planctomycetota bacterium]
MSLSPPGDKLQACGIGTHIAPVVCQVEWVENLGLINTDLREAPTMAMTQPNSIDIEKWLGLIRADNVGATTFAKLIKHFGSANRALGASVSELAKVNGIGYKKAERIAATRGKFDVAAELELAAKLGVWIINLDDKRYPPALRQIYDPPPVIYIKGSLCREDNLAISIVGSRRCSLYGQEQASRLAHFLSSAGFTICSGMARGIDTAAHQGALSAGGRTIAVHGCGLKNIYPPENKKLFELITESGACISELPLQCEPLSENFPPRNRIVAGLSLGTIVIEAGLRSGALISARMAMENNREVMAMPGKIDSPVSRGTHRLIKQGAKLIESVEDVMEALGYIGEQLEEHVSAAAQKAAEKIETPLFEIKELKLSRHEKIIFEYLNKEPLHIEQIIADTDLAAGSVNAGLVSLRLKGLIKQLPGSLFVRK